MPKLPDAEVLYHHWVYEGLSLRKIGRIYGRSRTSIWTTIRKVYGSDACNPKVNGLARVVAEEYGQAYMNTVNRAHGIPGRYLTSRKEQNLSTFQSIDFLDNHVTSETIGAFNTFGALDTESKPEGLKLPLFLVFTKVIMGLLSDLI